MHEPIAPQFAQALGHRDQQRQRLRLPQRTMLDALDEGNAGDVFQHHVRVILNFSDIEHAGEFACRMRPRLRDSCINRSKSFSSSLISGCMTRTTTGTFNPTCVPR